MTAVFSAFKNQTLLMPVETIVQYTRDGVEHAARIMRQRMFRHKRTRALRYKYDMSDGKSIWADEITGIHLDANYEPIPVFGDSKLGPNWLNYLADLLAIQYGHFR